MTDQAVEQAPEPTEAQVVEIARRIGVPDVVLIDGLRQQVSVLNDEVVRLRIEIDFANGVIGSLQHTIEHMAAGTPAEHVHEEFAT